MHAHVLPGSARELLSRGGGDWFGMTLGLGAAGNPVMTTGGRARALGTAAYLHGIEQRLAWMDGARIDVQVLSIAPPLFGYDLPTPLAVALAREVNDDLAHLVSGAPQRFRGLATLPADPDAAVTELERVLALPAFVGVELGTNVDGADWDEAHLLPVLAAAERLGAFVFLHPNDVRSGQALARYHLRNLIGNPLETTAAGAALIFGGVLDRLPELRVCLSHGGGYLALAAGRFDHGHAVRPEARAACQAPPGDYLRRLHVDALVHSAATLRHVVDVFGADRVVLGSDHPADMGAHDPVTEIERNPLLSQAERSAILGQNLERELSPRPDPSGPGSRAGGTAHGWPGGPISPSGGPPTAPGGRPGR